MRESDVVRVMVTGGAGFLGSHLCERLAAGGCEVVCIDNFYTGTKQNLARLANNPSYELLRHDVTFPLYVEVDEIYNLACPASPTHDQFAKAKVLQGLTSEVYGDPEVHPQREDYWGRVNPIGPRACYDEGRRCNALVH